MSTNFGNLTDQQLRQTINSLSNAARYGDQYTPTAQAAAASQNRYKHNLQSWSAESTPPPKAQGSSRPSRRAATRQSTAQSYTTPSTPVANAASTYQQSAAVPAEATVAATTAVPMQTQSVNPPPAPIPTKHQGYQSTYSSRMRTGCTLLMQPTLASSSTNAGRVTARRAAVINYADPGSGDDMLDAGAIDSDDSDAPPAATPRAGLRQTRSRAGAGGASVPNVAAIASSSKAVATPPPPAPLSDVLDQSYLGMIPPDRFIKTRYIAPTTHEYASQEVAEREAYKTPALVPIRVEFETDTHRIRDCFVWNLREVTITPENFARTFCNDLELPLNPWVETISNQIKAQLEDYEGIASMDLGLDGAVDAGMDEDVLNTDEVPECRVILSIDVQIATYHLMDHIEWDLLSPLTPEEFSRKLCAELGLAGEAVALIAHAVHEELMKHKKDAVEWGVIGGEKESQNASLQAALGTDDRGIFVKDKTGLGHNWGRTPRDGRGPKVLRSVWRDWADAEEYRTRFEVLTAEEVERREIEKERASRRLRRETSKFQNMSRTSRRYRY